MKSILTPGFRYTPSVATDLKKTFARVRREQRKAPAHAPITVVRVVPINRKGCSK
jgi:hypothetical protein